MEDEPARDRGGSVFPLRVAAVDVGSNAVRFTAAEFRGPSSHRELAYVRVPVRMGHGAFLTGRLEAGNLDAAVEALASFRRTMDALAVVEHRAVATSAVRESRNGDELADRARREAGLDLEAITGREETRLVRLAVRDRLPLDGRWMMVDLGGGSLDASVVDDSGVEWSESYPLGTVRLLEELDGPDPAPGALSRLIEAHAGSLQLPRLEDEGLRGLIATGGNIEALAELAGAAPDPAGVSRLPVAALRATAGRLGAMTNRRRIAELELRPDRADVIVPAAHVYLRVAELTEAAEILVPHVGVKEGVLLDLVAERATRGPAV